MADLNTFLSGSTKDKDLIKTNFIGTFEFRPILKQMPSEELEIVQGPTIISTRPINTGTDYSFILDHSTYGVLGTSTLGDYRGTAVVQRVVNPNNTWRELIRNDTFDDSSTADWDTTEHEWTFEIDEYIQTKTIFKNDDTIYKATINLNEDLILESGALTYYLSADGGSHWEQAYNNTEHSFSNTGKDLRLKIICVEYILNPVNIRSYSNFDFTAVGGDATLNETTYPTGSSSAVNLTKTITSSTECSFTDSIYNGRQYPYASYLYMENSHINRRDYVVENDVIYFYLYIKDATALNKLDATAAIKLSLIPHIHSGTGMIAYSANSYYKEFTRASLSSGSWQKLSIDLSTASTTGTVSRTDSLGVQRFTLKTNNTTDTLAEEDIIVGRIFVDEAEIVTNKGTISGNDIDYQYTFGTQSDTGWTGGGGTTWEGKTTPIEVVYVTTIATGGGGPASP